MKLILNLILLIMSTISFSQTSIHEFSFLSIDGIERQFSEFKGKKILIVNTASECGFTPQYEELQKVHEAYREKLVVIGFPANNFGAQEPGSNDQIAAFCKKNYGVTFLMAEKISVAGSDIHPIFQWLCQQENPDFTGAINWNFEKFLLNEKGELMGRFRSAVKPDSEKIINLLDQ